MTFGSETELPRSVARALSRTSRALVACTVLSISACAEGHGVITTPAGAAGASASDGGGGAPAADGVDGGDAGDGRGGDEEGGGGAAADHRIPAAVVFAEGQLIEYRVTIDPADWESLEQHGDDEEYRPAALGVRGSVLGELGFERVGIRLKGAWSLHHCWDDFGGVRSYADECAKLSYKLKFDEYEANTRFEGLKRLNLHASAGDETILREMLAYSSFNDFGVSAPRTAPAKLYVNDELLGLFIAVEQVDGRYTDFHFPEGGDGNLYKEVWPRAGLDDPYFMEALRTNEDSPDVSDMQGFAAAIEATTESSFDADLATWVDLDAILHYIAVDRALKNWDGIMAFYSPLRPHNYYWYHDDGAHGRFHLIPWDLNTTLWEFDPFMDPQQWVTAEPVPDWNVLPASCEPISVWEPNSVTRITPPGCDKFLRILAATKWNRFVEIGEELLSGPFRYEAMADKVTRWAELIEPIIEEDPYFSAAAWRAERDEFYGTLREAIADFRAYLAEGYVIEEPEQALPEPSAAELDEPMPESGIVVDRVNNFEFTGGAADTVPAGVFSYGADGVTHAASWNTSDPLSGTADLRFDFEFTRNPEAWDEWVDVGLSTAGGQQIDISPFAQISITLRADRLREVRIRVDSPAYEDVFGGAWVEFGADYSVSTEPTVVKMRLDRLYYPDWAKEPWTDGQGWTTSDDEALLVLLQCFDGLRFGPRATTDSSGELVNEVETGYLQIDNIYFQ